MRCNECALLGKHHADCNRNTGVCSCESVDPSTNYLPRVHSNGHDTERAAAKAAMPRTGSMAMKALHAFVQAHPEGLHDEELKDICDPDGAHSAIRGGRARLVELGLVHDSGQRRPYRSGNSAIVWVLTEKGERLTGLAEEVSV